MARSQLYVRWRKEKAQRRKTQPKSFSNRGTSTFYSHVKKTEAIYQGQQRITGSVATAKERSEEVAKRFKFYANRLQPEHKALFILLKDPLREATEKLAETSPKISVEILKDMYSVQDERLSAFKFDVVHLESSDYHDKWLYFRGRECFIVFRRDHTLTISERYENVHFLKSLPLKKVQWAGEPYILSYEELKEFSSNS